MEINPHQGVGPVKFGMSPKQVKKVMGREPVYEDWMGGNLNDSLLYPGMIISFDECDAKGPLPHSKVVGFRLNSVESLVFHHIPLSKLNLNLLKEMEVMSVTPTLDENRNLIFKELGLEFGLYDDGRLWGVQMWLPAKPSQVR